MRTCPDCAAAGPPVPLAPLADGGVLCRCSACGSTHRRNATILRVPSRLPWRPVLGEA